jgi:hypothetical protein
LTERPIRRSSRIGASNAIVHRREPPPRQAELICPDLVPGVRRIKHREGKKPARPCDALLAPGARAARGQWASKPITGTEMKNSRYLDKPLVPLAVALRSMLAQTGTKIATAAPAEKARLQQRAQMLREWLTPRQSPTPS